MKNAAIYLVLLMLSNQLYGQSSTYPVVHTGVIEFYDEEKIIATPSENDYLYWQDAGRVVNSPSYTNNGDGTITDNITGLMWQQYMGEKITYADAGNKVDTLTLGEFTDWRIPTIKELYSLILFTGKLKGEDADKLFIDTNYFDQPLGDTSIGEREIDGQTWSSTHYTGLTMNADTTVFGVNFVDGRIKGYPKYRPQENTPKAMFFRMVRGNTQYGINSFQHNEDGTITDNATNLMWQKSDDGIARDWLEALSYCEGLELAGNTDWHLPNVKELKSIVDYSRSPMKTQSPAIDPLFDVTEINDPDGNPGHYPFFWSSSSHLDGANPYASAAYIAFGKALGKMKDVLMDVHGAGAQRSDPKVEETGRTYPLYRGPQGDLVMVNNHCRCVRNIGTTSSLIDKDLTERIKVYPNPSNRFITISAKELYDIEIIDLTGKVLVRTLMQDNTITMDTNGLERGIYIVLLENSEGSVVKKFIKE